LSVLDVVTADTMDGGSFYYTQESGNFGTAGNGQANSKGSSALCG
jgi:hypothetical protein